MWLCNILTLKQAIGTDLMEVTEWTAKQLYFINLWDWFFKNEQKQTKNPSRQLN